MHIAIVGSGAIGSTFGALLARSGQGVTLVGRPEHVAVIRRDGLRVDGALGDFTVPVAAAEALTFRPDLALLAVKTQDVAAAVQDNLAFLTGVPVLTCQNGVRSDDIVAERLPRETIVSAVVSTNATYVPPGWVTVAYLDMLIVCDAGLDHSSPKLKRVTSCGNLVHASALRGRTA